MKKTILALTLISNLTFFQGCEESDFNPFKEGTEYIDLTFTKTKDATLFSLDKYSKGYDYYSSEEYRVSSDYDPQISALFNRFGDDYNLDENNKRVYIPRLAFHFKTTLPEDAAYSFVLDETYLIPCDSKEEYPYLDRVNHTDIDRSRVLLDIPLSASDDDNENNSIYFNIREMQQYGLVTKDRTKQKDLCILTKWYDHVYMGRTGGYNAYYKSNRLRFTAEEISNVVQEYDEAGFSREVYQE